MKKFIRLLIQNRLGYWFYKAKHLPIGTDIAIDLTQKIAIPIREIMDVGANIGQSALSYRQLFPNSTIYCFEPVPAIFQKLENQTQHDNAIFAYHLGVGSTSGDLKMALLDDPLAQQHSFNTNQNNESETVVVPVTTIDDFLSKNNIEEIDLLKIDTEGFELHVLKGAENSISANKIKLVYLEVGLSSKNKHNSSFMEVFATMERLGFTFYGLYEISHIGIQSNCHYGNALFVHHSALEQLKNWQID